jgi:carbon monoxide dehydrogenase subunit G
MEMQGTRHLAVSQQQAWDALNDPQVLKVCIPGCEKIEVAGDNEYAIGLGVKVGPVAAKFNGRIRLQDVMAPNGYTLAFEGNGGAAGFGKGSARVKLSPPTEGAGCELDYTAQAQVGGKIAQVGQRLVDGVARSMAEDFFRRFDEEMQRRHPEAFVVREEPAGLPVSPLGGTAAAARLPLWAWAVFGVVVVVALLMLAR